MASGGEQTEGRKDRQTDSPYFIGPILAKAKVQKKIIHYQVIFLASFSFNFAVISYSNTNIHTHAYTNIHIHIYIHIHLNKNTDNILYTSK